MEKPGYALLLAMLYLSEPGMAQISTADPTQKQVKFFFPGDKMKSGAKFNFPMNFTEVPITTKDNIDVFPFPS
ncbi:hypothetical protein ADIARSV_1779 [Arcticibacter svalbardensis MN12-7]|uniref:Uncharacterized protein n=1 Tax=Arcticibacter svalbardensis MN12-7 TaxID=1150600 RepID=R9H1I8_9SPHI|nr:hypothetical protein ADIARSV_1779 [Arcticibacter svalbardensis MN12-7]